MNAKKKGCENECLLVTEKKKNDENECLLVTEKKKNDDEVRRRRRMIG